MQELAHARQEPRTLMCAGMRTAAILHNDGLRSALKRTNRAAVRNDALCNMAASEEAGAQRRRLSWQEDGARAQRVRTIARQEPSVFGRARRRTKPARDGRCSRRGTCGAGARSE
ncbi:hypothetical protein GCM10009105_25560 [Dokdonella soli]|uniref:Uncharacterized protein n=1 Tax=Dokdonella soli TaxID=529810 RepID=A0ABN1INI4_9GAMM